MYEIAQGARLPAFRDVTLGGNAVETTLAPATTWSPGLGTPDVENLAQNLLAVQKNTGVG